MAPPAGGPPRARGIFGAALLLAVYLLAAWPIHMGFFFLPLAGLLALARPRTLREYAWLGVGLCWAVLWLPRPGPMHLQAVKAGVVMATGALIALRMARPALGPGAASLAAVGLGALGTLIWSAGLGFNWEAMEASALREGWASYRALVRETAGANPVLAQGLKAGIAPAASLFPGLAALLGLAGLRLAWGWHRRIARTPLEPAPTGLRAFRFDDQLVWALALALALVLFVPAGPGAALGQNLLVVFGALYAARGLGVTATLAAGLPRYIAALLAASALLLFPFAATGLFVLGVADTWVDFRRRLAPPLPGGQDR
ncbi:MAG TPA: DUF2232 domain-containing protein [Gemmatimonadales bacterium]|nr:DUF2232 domain-containing protein [Gemmatimonadales bacterium]